MQRPDTVPADATWQPDDSEWMLAEVDDDGEHHGTVTWWRPDGTRCCVTEYVHGTAHGRFERFHENGETSRVGTFVDGQLHGTNTFTRSTAETTEVFPPGLGDAVWSCQMDYDSGSIVEARAYARDGSRCLEDGTPYPTTMPAGVPSSAHFRKRESDQSWVWVDGAVTDNGDGTIARTGTWRFWSPEGVLLSESTYVDGEETGPFVRLADEGRYADPRVVRERGTLRDGHPVRRLELLDDGGAVVQAVDLGEVSQPAAVADLMNADQVGPDWIEALDGQGLRVVGFLAAVFAGHEPDALRERLAGLQYPLSEEAVQHATHRAKMVASNVVRFGGGPVQVLDTLLDGIRAGGDAAELLRQGAATLDDMHAEEIAIRLVDAACAIDPDEVSYEYTRALVRMSHGDPEGAAASVRRLAEGAPDAAKMLETYRSALFADLAAPLSEDPRLALAQRIAPMLPQAHRQTAPPAAVVRRGMQQAATRIEHARAALLERFGDQPWIPASQAHLLPDGPVEVELPDFAGIGFLHAARRDVLRLRWLCWCLGLDGRFLPDTVEIDTSRPSRALALVVLARGLQLQSGEADVSEWLEDLDDDARDRVSRELAEAVPQQTWYGMTLAECDGAAHQFAFEDELCLFRMFLQWWNDSDEGSWYDHEAAA